MKSEQNARRRAGGAAGIDPLRRIEALEKITGLMNNISDLRRLLRKIMEISEKLLDAEASSVLLYDPLRRELYFEIARGDKARRITRRRLGMDKGIAGYAARTGEVVNVANTEEDAHFFPGIDSITGFHTHSVLAVPLMRRRRLLGVIEVINRRGTGRFSQEDAALMKIVAAQAAMAIDNARLYEKNLRDFADRETGWLKKAFQTYTPPEVVNGLLNNHGKLKLSGSRKHVSVLFSDIMGFSSLAERFDPVELAALVNSYLNPMGEAILLYRGTIDKYIGDAMMAFFGAPLPVPNHPEMAIGAALRMAESIRGLNPAWRKAGLPEISIGIGINTGTVSVGNIGSEKRFNYTVMGDNVNLAERLEKLTRVYNCTILVSGATRDRVKDTFCCREIDLARVKGRGKPVRVYEPVALWAKTSPELEKMVVSFESGLAFYRRGEKREARACFREVLKTFPGDGPSRYYLDLLSSRRTAGMARPEV